MCCSIADVAGLEIIFEESPDTMTGQIHFSSVIPRFCSDKIATCYFLLIIYYI